MKLDGCLARAALGMGGVKSRTRNGDDWTDRFTELDPALAQLSCDTGLIDGEILAGAGLEGFAALREAIKAGGPFRYVAFDLLNSTGRSCRTIPSMPAARRWSICSATRPPVASSDFPPRRKDWRPRCRRWSAAPVGGRAYFQTPDRLLSPRQAQRLRHGLRRPAGAQGARGGVMDYPVDLAKEDMDRVRVAGAGPLRSVGPGSRCLAAFPKAAVRLASQQSPGMIAAMQDFAAVNRYSKPEMGRLSGLNPVQ